MHESQAILPRAMRSRPGFTLVELLISLTLSTIVVGALFGTIVAAQKNYTKQRSSRVMEENLRTAEQVLRTVLTNATADPYRTGQALLNPDSANGGSFNSIWVKSDFNPPNGAFTDELEDVQVKVVADTLRVRWQAGAAYQALAYPVNSIAFDYYDVSNTLLTTVASVANATTVRITITVPDRHGSTGTLRRQSWVFLRNRR
jgi:prepilin-type N-terminal cleavage/methylation domain-containing protein